METQNLQQPKFLIDDQEEVTLSYVMSKESGIAKWQRRDIAKMPVGEVYTFNEGENSEWNIKRTS